MATEEKPVRRVKWRRTQVQTFIAGALVLLLCIVAIVGEAYQQGRESIRLQHVMQPTTATVTRRWKDVKGPVTHYWVAYHYAQLPAGTSDPTLEVPHLWWAEMQPGSHLSIQYNPADPEVNGLEGNKAHLFEKWIWTGGLASACSILALLAFYARDWWRKRQEFWLVRNGKTTVGEITDIRETMIKRGDHQRWRYELAYQFPMPDGTLKQCSRAEVAPEQKNWDIGSLVTIFYDPGQPQRHALYGDLPAEVV